LKHQKALGAAVVGIEDLINSSGAQQTANILAGDQIGDDVVHFVGWGDFSLTKGHFLPTGTDSICEGELMGFYEDGSFAG
jgi:hypothetical protein